VLFGRSRLLVAFDASSVCGAVVSRGLGRVRLRRLARVGLPEGALQPSAFDPNLVQPQEVREALLRLRQGLERAGRLTTLILPDGVARLALLEAPPGTAPRAYARFLLTQSLPYPAGEAIVDVLPLGGRRVVGAVVRRGIVEGYEAAAAAAGFAQERVDIAPLAALAGLLRRARPPSVDVILGEAAVCLAAFDGRSFVVLRNRRRDSGPDEAERLREEVDRTAALAGAGDVPVAVTGAGAGRLVRELSSRGRGAVLASTAPGMGPVAEAAELAWLGAAVA
jgi:hypothetical protein